MASPSSTNISSSTAGPSAQTKATDLTPPMGWSNDADHMSLWQGRNTDLSTILAEWYDLPDAQPLITRLPDPSDAIFLFQSGGKYYI